MHEQGNFTAYYHESIKQCILDIWDKDKRSAVMAKIHSKDTKPELLVRRYLWQRGYRYRKNVRGLPGTPDIVLRKYGVVIFIHGCFWHGHDVDGHIPQTNSLFWKEKIERNKLRDERNKAELKRLGWGVMTIWECQLKPAVREQTLRNSLPQRHGRRGRNRLRQGRLTLPVFALYLRPARYRQSFSIKFLV